MNRYLLYLIVPLLSFGLIGCNDKEDVNSMDLHLFDGVWEVVDQGGQDVFEKYCCLDISTVSDGGNGSITTFYPTLEGAVIHDKVYYWSIREIENYQHLLDLVFLGDLDGVARSGGNCSYKITRLTDAHMWWQANSDGDNSVIKFRRRTKSQAE